MLMINSIENEMNIQILIPCSLKDSMNEGNFHYYSVLMFHFAELGKLEQIKIDKFGQPIKYLNGTKTKGNP